MAVAASHAVAVRPAARMFSVVDPSCDYLESIGAADQGAMRGGVGWSRSALSVATFLDIVPIVVTVDLWTESPGATGSPEEDLLNESTLEVPGGTLAFPEAIEEPHRLGIDLPGGGGTYAVRLVGRNLHRIKRLFEETDLRFSQPESRREAAVNSLRGVESYQIQIWQVSGEPRWRAEDEED